MVQAFALYMKIYSYFSGVRYPIPLCSRALVIFLDKRPLFVLGFFQVLKYSVFQHLSLHASKKRLQIRVVVVVVEPGHALAMAELGNQAL